LAHESVFIFLLFAAIAYPYRFQSVFGPFNSFSIAEIALLAAWCCTGIAHIIPHKKTASTETSIYSTQFWWLDVSIILYVLINVISGLWARDTRLFFRGLVPILENVAFYYLIVAFARTKPRVRLTFRIFLALGVVSLVLSALYYFGRMEFLEIVPSDDLLQIVSNQTRLGSPAWGASNYYASIMLLFIPTYLSFALLSKSFRVLLIFSLISAGSLVALFFTFSRGGYVALIISLIFGLTLLLHQRKISRRTVVTVWGLGLLTVCVMYFLYVNFSEIETALAEIQNRVLTIEDTNAQIRWHLFKIAWQSASSNMLGLGLGNFPLLWDLGNFGVHNAYLQVTLETGWGGFAIFLTMLFMLLRANIRLFNRMKHTPYAPLAIGLLVSFIAILINIFGEATFDGIVFGWVFWLTQGMVRAMLEQDQILRPSPIRDHSCAFHQ
jgi:O-antigen ligase